MKNSTIKIAIAVGLMTLAKLLGIDPIFMATGILLSELNDIQEVIKQEAKK